MDPPAVVIVFDVSEQGAATLCALAVAAAIRVDRSRTVLLPFDDEGWPRLQAVLADLRYRGQSLELTVPVSGCNGPVAQLRDAKLHRPGSRLAVPVTIPVALRQALAALLAIGRPRQGAHLQLHHALGRKADHPAQHIRVGALLKQLTQAHHLVGRRCVFRFRLVQATPTLTG